MRKICRSSQFMTKILSEENVFQISAVPTGVYGRYPPMLKSCGLYPFHGALQVPALMGVLASVCTPSPPLPTRKQQLPTSSAQQCREFLRPFARTYKKKIAGWRHVRPRQGRLGTRNEGVSEVVFGSAQLCNWGVTLFFRVKQAPDNFTGNSKHFFVIVG